MITRALTFKSPRLGLAAMLLCSFLLGACDGNNGEPIMSFITNSRMVVTLKGTYASDRPLELNEINNDVIFTSTDTTINTTGVPSMTNLLMLFDIGDIRMSTKNFMQTLDLIQTNDDSDEFWDVVSTERQVYCSNFYATDSGNDGCLDTGGIQNYRDFMSGRGAQYPARDVGPGTYLHTGVFVRGFVTGHAIADGVTQTSNFDNNQIFNSANILPLLNFDPGIDVATQAVARPQFFPLHHRVVWGQQVHMQMDNTSLPVVLDIRMNIKENMMVQGFTSTTSQAVTVVAPSDWRRPHTGQFTLGGNVLLRSRIYYPNLTTHLRVLNQDPDTGTPGSASNRHYYAIFTGNVCDSFGAQAGDCSENDQLPLAATPVRDNDDNTMLHLMAGSYKIQCRYDCKRDGYPEAILSESTFNVGVGNGISFANLTFQCGTAPPASLGCD